MLPLEVKRVAEAKRGRPSKYDAAIAEEICDRIADGEKLHEICADPHMPSSRTVYRWREDDKEFDREYHCALLARFDRKCHDLEDIAADGSKDYELTDGDVPTLRVNPEVLGRTQLRINLAWKIMAKELPRKYGEPAKVAAPAEQPAQPAPGQSGQGGKVIDITAELEAATFRSRAAAAK